MKTKKILNLILMKKLVFRKMVMKKNKKNKKNQMKKQIVLTPMN